MRLHQYEDHLSIKGQYQDNENQYVYLTKNAFPDDYKELAQISKKKTTLFFFKGAKDLADTSLKTISKWQIGT